MAYTPTTWAKDDVITSAKLNKMEQGIAGAGGCVIVETEYNSDSSKYISVLTGAEVWGVVSGGRSVIFHFPASIDSVEMYVPLLSIKDTNDSYYPISIDQAATYLTVWFGEGGYYEFVVDF